MKSASPRPRSLVARDLFSIRGIYKCSTIYIQKLLQRTPLAYSLADLITSFLHGDHPPGILVGVGVAVVLEVGVVPLYHHTELAALWTPSKAAELELNPTGGRLCESVGNYIYQNWSQSLLV